MYDGNLWKLSCIIFVYAIPSFCFMKKKGQKKLEKFSKISKRVVDKSVCDASPKGNEGTQDNSHKEHKKRSNYSRPR